MLGHKFFNSICLLILMTLAAMTQAASEQYIYMPRSNGILCVTVDDAVELVDVQERIDDLGMLTQPVALDHDGQGHLLVLNADGKIFRLPILARGALGDGVQVGSLEIPYAVGGIKVDAEKRMYVSHRNQVSFGRLNEKGEWLEPSAIMLPEASGIHELALNGLGQIYLVNGSMRGVFGQQLNDDGTLNGNVFKTSHSEYFSNNGPRQSCFDGKGHWFVANRRDPRDQGGNIIRFSVDGSGNLDEPERVAADLTANAQVDGLLYHPGGFLLVFCSVGPSMRYKLDDKGNLTEPTELVKLPSVGYAVCPQWPLMGSKGVLRPAWSPKPEH